MITGNIHHVRTMQAGQHLVVHCECVLKLIHGVENVSKLEVATGRVNVLWAHLHGIRMHTASDVQEKARTTRPTHM